MKKKCQWISEFHCKSFFESKLDRREIFRKLKILHLEIKSDFYQIKLNPYKIIRNYSSNPRYRNRKYNENESNKYVQCKITFWLQSLGKSCTRKNFTWNNAFLRARDSKGCIKCGKGVFFKWKVLEIVWSWTCHIINIITTFRWVG